MYVSKGDGRASLKWQDSAFAAALAESLIPLQVTEVTFLDSDCHSFCEGNNNPAGSSAVSTDLPPSAVVTAHYPRVPVSHWQFHPESRTCHATPFFVCLFFFHQNWWFIHVFKCDFYKIFNFVSSVWWNSLIRTYLFRHKLLIGFH